MRPNEFQKEGAMSIAENIKTAEEHLEAERKRELDRLLGTLAEE